MQKIAHLLDKADEDELRLILATVEKKLGDYEKTKSRLKTDTDLFVVSDDLKYLSFEELILAGKSFKEWFKAARTATQKRSRARIYLVFLIIRYGALRLGEALSLDDEKDFDEGNSEIIVRSTHARRVQIPEEIMSQILAMLDDPMFAGIRGEVAHLDQGYIRRKFYERAKECKIERSFFNPRSVRNSRAIELLRGGVPMRVVNSFLGQPTPNTSDQYFDLPSDTTSRIVQEYIDGEYKLKTSARNAFTGKVSKIAHGSPLVEVEISTMAGYKVVSMITEESFANLQLIEGMVATATIKAPEIILGPTDQKIRTSARNTFKGRVAEIKSTDVVAEVTVDLELGGAICSVMTTDSSDFLGLEKGKEIMVMFKAFSVILNKE